MPTTAFVGAGYGFEHQGLCPNGFGSGGWVGDWLCSLRVSIRASFQNARP